MAYTYINLTTPHQKKTAGRLGATITLFFHEKQLEKLDIIRVQRRASLIACKEKPSEEFIFYTNAAQMELDKNQ
jgi:hypothetical protein